MQVVFTGFTAGAPVFAMIQVAVSGGSSAVREHAGLVSGDDVVGERLGWPVGFAPVFQELPRYGVGEESAPGAGGVGGDAAGRGGGDGSVPVEVGGQLVAAEQGGGGDGDVDGGSLSVVFGQVRVTDHAGEHVDQGVGAALVDHSTIARCFG